jgi:hypothetical protein
MLQVRVQSNAHRHRLLSCWTELAVGSAATETLFTWGAIVALKHPGANGSNPRAAAQLRQHLFHAVAGRFSAQVGED